tara:strand:- start:374 stop:889 length:516 start_codon:yes stop_codon:yes gene_type:complete
MKKLLTLSLLVILMTSCEQNQELKSKNSKTFNNTSTIIKINQEVPNIIHIDLDKEGASHGDLLAFDADVITNNNIKGKLSGYLLTIFIPEENHENFQEKMLQMVFDFGEGNTIVVGGKSIYPNIDKSEIVENQPQLRAIIGGTGSFIGARGQISTKRNDDGTYEHFVELVE